MSFSFRPAKREAASLILGITGPSGGGKTYSALRVATGLAGGARIACIDTEAGRMSHYADAFTFDVGEMKPPFSPAAYAEAIAAADAAGYPVIVVDSFSHEHAGEGGLLDMQMAEFERLGNREAAKMASWIKPKAEHKRMVNRLLQIRAHLILCLRAEQKVDIVQEGGKMVVRPKTTLSGFSEWIPVAEKNLLFELTASALVTPDAPGVPKWIKLPQALREMIPAGVLTEATGERLAAWAKGGGAVEAGVASPVSAPRTADAFSDKAPSGSTPASGAGSPAPASDMATELSSRIRRLVTNRRLSAEAFAALCLQNGLGPDTWESADVSALADLFTAINKLPREGTR